jgi:hypothetical protein
MHSIDHLVLPVTTLTLARSRLSGLGFTVAPDARHPFGTGNCCVFFKNETYLEPIAILDRTATDQAAAEGLHFVKRLKRFTERQGEGFAMAAFRSADAEADQARLKAAGLSAGSVFRFSRPAKLPDGSDVEISVALAYADDPGAADATLFTCQRSAPELLFQPEYVEHANGVVGIHVIVAVAAEPAEHAHLEAMFQSDLEEEPATLEIVTPPAYAERFGIEPPDPKRGLLLAGIELAVQDLDRAMGFAGPTAVRRGEFVIVPPAPGLGACLAFRAKHE